MYLNFVHLTQWGFDTCIAEGSLLAPLARRQQSDERFVYYSYPGLGKCTVPEPFLWIQRLTQTKSCTQVEVNRYRVVLRPWIYMVHLVQLWRVPILDWRYIVLPFYYVCRPEGTQKCPYTNFLVQRLYVPRQGHGSC